MLLILKSYFNAAKVKKIWFVYSSNNPLLNWAICCTILENYAKMVRSLAVYPPTHKDIEKG